MKTRICYLVFIIFAGLAGGCGDFSGLESLGGDWFHWPDHFSLPSKKADIYSIQADGANLVRLTFDEKSLHPQFSPDGTKILFISASAIALNSAGNDPVNLNIMNIDGTARETLVSNVKGYYASYSRDGSTIAYVSGNPNNYKDIDTICFLSTTSRTQSRLTNSLSPANPQFSFDDTKVYFLAGHNGLGYSLCSVKIDGSDSHDCIPSNVIHFDCSPVDEKIVVENLAGGGEDLEVSIVNSEGVILNRLMYVDYPYFGCIGNSTPQFSPDGATVIFSRLVFDSSNGSRSWIYKASVDGSTLVKLAEGDNASFSPDGSKIVYRCYAGVGTTWSICIINADGTHSQKLFNIDTGIGDLSFSPDGTRIVFTIYKNCIVF